MLLVLVFSALQAFRLRLQQKGSIDDDGFSDFQTRKDLNFATKVTATTDGPNVEFIRPSWDEYNPPLPGTLQRSCRHREHLGRAIRRDQKSRSRHPWTQRSPVVSNFDADRHGA
jgi:hypothetical protein